MIMNKSDLKCGITSESVDGVPEDFLFCVPIVAHLFCTISADSVLCFFSSLSVIIIKTTWLQKKCLGKRLHKKLHIYVVVYR